MSEHQVKVSISFKVDEKQPVMLISPDGYLPPWAVRGLLFLDTNVTGKLISGSPSNVTPWSTGWLMQHSSDFALNPLLWAYEQAYRLKDPAARFASNLAKAGKAFMHHGYRVHVYETRTQDILYTEIDKLVRPTECQLEWLKLCVARKLSAGKLGRRKTVVGAAVAAREQFSGKNLGLSLFAGLLVTAGHHGAWRLVKGATPYTDKAAANAILDLNGYLAYLLYRNILADAGRSAATSNPSIWFATADKPLAHVMLNGHCRATFNEGSERINFDLGPVLAKDLHPEALAGIHDALDVINERPPRMDDQP